MFEFGLVLCWVGLCAAIVYAQMQIQYLSRIVRRMRVRIRYLEEHLLTPAQVGNPDPTISSSPSEQIKVEGKV